MATTTYVVSGMTCGHCVKAVSDELAALDGVQDVAVDLDSGRVRVASEGALDETLVRAAVHEAGYEVVG